MTNFDNHDELLEIIIEALQKAGKRGVIYGLSSTKQLPDTICSIDAVPHTWLFPKMSAVCHHGGAGTSAAGVAAGIQLNN